MTIASQTSRIIYTGDGTTTAFSVPFYFAANADLVVIFQDTLGNQTTQTLGTNYSLTGATVSAGGTCTFTIAPTTGYLVTIYRDPAITQTTSYSNNDPFPAKSHELALDKLTTIAQRLKDLLSRTLHLTEGETTITTALASVATRKNKLLSFDSTGAISYSLGPTFVGNTATGVAVVDSRATAAVTTFAGSVNVIVTEGQATPGDGLGNVYIRGVAGAPGAFQDGAGVYWKFAAVVAPFTPQGRLTALSATPFPAIDVIGSQNLYYGPAAGEPATGKSFPVLVSGVWTSNAFTSSATDQVGLTLALAGSANWAAGTIHDVFGVVDSGTPKIGTRLWDSSMLPSANAVATVTTVITTGTTPNAWSRASTAFDGTTVQNSATGAQVVNLGIVNFLGSDWGAGVTKIVTSVQAWAASDNTFIGGSIGGTCRINVEGSNDGTNFTLLGYADAPNTVNGSNVVIPVGSKDAFRYHRVGFQGDNIHNNNVAEVKFTVEVPATTRRLSLYDSILVNDAVMTLRTGAATTISVAQNEGTYLGSIMIDAASNGQITCHRSYGPSRVYNIFNYYNRIPMQLRAGAYYQATSGATNSYTVTANSWAVNRADATNCLTVLIGYADQYVKITHPKCAYLNAGAATQDYSSAIGVDSTSTYSGTYWSAALDATGQAIGMQGQSMVVLPPFAGTRKASMIEFVPAGANAVSSFVNEQNTMLLAEWRG